MATLDFVSLIRRQGLHESGELDMYSIQVSEV